MRPRLFQRLSLLILTLALPAPAAAGVGVWTPASPDGGFVTALAVDPTNPNVVYAGTQSSGIFKSTDGGASWSLAGRGLGTAVLSTLVIDPARPQTVYAATLFNGLFKSTNGGASWGLIWPPLPNVGFIYDLALDPRRPGTLYAGTNGGVFRSTDGGAIWSRRGNLHYVRSLALDSPGGWLYAGTDGAVFRSFNQGQTWEPAGDGAFMRQVESLAIDPDRPRALLAATLTGIYRSPDRGKSWQAASGPLSQARAVVFQRGTGLAYAAFDTALFRSSDGGASWQQSPFIPSAFGFTALAAGPQMAYAGSSGAPGGGGLFRSLNGGARWARSESGLQAAAAGPVAIDPANPQTLLAAVNRTNLFRSTNGGATWTVLFRGPRQPNVPVILDILFDPDRPGRVYVLLGQGILRSDDTGTTWQHLVNPTSPFLADLALDPRAPNALWAVGAIGADHSVFHSADGGATWQRSEGLRDLFSLERVEVDPSDPEVLYAGGRRFAGSWPLTFAPQLWRSADGGQTWEHRDTGLTTGEAVLDIAVDTTDPSTLYAVTPWLHRSTDSGATWQLLGEGPNTYSAAVLTVPAGPGTPAAVYSARQNPSAVLRSTDQGDTWTPLRQGLAAYAPLALVVNPDDPTQLYLGTVNGGLLTYTLP